MQEKPHIPPIDKEALDALEKALSPEALPSPEVIRNVVFEEKHDKKGGVTKIRSSAMGRKEYILDPASYGLLEEVGKPYTVKILRDTNPDDPSKGSFVVEIVLDGSPQEAKKSPSKWHKLGDLKEIIKLTSTLNNAPHNYEAVIDKVRSLKLPPHVLASTEIQKAAASALKSLLAFGDVTGASKVRDTFRLSPETIRPLLESRAADLLETGQMTTLEEFKKKFNLPKEFFSSSAMQVAGAKGIAGLISRGSIQRAVRIKNLTGISKEALSNPALLEGIQKGYVNLLRFGHSQEINELTRSFDLPKEVMQELYVAGVTELLATGQHDRAIDFIRTKGLKEQMTYPKVKEAALKALAAAVKRRSQYDTRAIVEHFALPEEDVSKIVLQEMPAIVAGGDFNTILVYEREYKVSVSKLNPSELQTSALTGVASALERGWVREALKYKERFKLSNEVLAASPAVMKAAAARFGSFIESNDYYEARDIRKSFPIDEKAANAVYKSALIRFARYGEYSNMLSLVQEMNAPKEVLEAPEVRGIVERRIVHWLERNELQSALEFKRTFKISGNAASSEEIRRASRSLMDFYMTRDSFDSVILLQKEFPIGKEEMNELLRRRIVHHLLQENVSYIVRYKENFNLHKSFFNTPEMVERVRGIFFDRLTRDRGVRELLSLEILSPKIIHEEAKQALSAVLQNGGSPEGVLQLGVLKGKDLHSPELTKFAQEAILTRLDRNSTNIEIFVQFDVPQSFFEDEENLKHAEATFMNNLKLGQWKLDDLKLFNLRDRVLSSEETIENFKHGAAYGLSDRGWDMDMFKRWSAPIEQELWGSSPMPQEVLQDILHTALHRRMERGKNFDDLIKLLPKDVLESQETQGAIKTYLIDRLARGVVARKDYLALASKDTLSSSEIQAAAERGLMEAFKRLADNKGEEKETDEDDEGARASIKYIMERYPLPPDMRRIVEMAREMFGNTFSLEQFTLIKAGQRGEKIPPEFLASIKGTGLEKLGSKELIPALKEMIASFRTALLDDLPDTSLLKAPFFKDLLRTLVRDELANKHFGRNFTFSDVLNDYIRRTEGGDKHTLPEGYVSSKGIRIQKTERDKLKFTEAFTSKYGSLKDDLEIALELVEYEAKPFSALAKQVTELRDKLVPELAEKLTKIENPKGREHLERSLDALKALNPRSVKDFEKNFALLANYKEFEPLMRRAVFLKSLQKHAPYRDQAREVTERREPIFDDITWMNNYMTEVTHRDTWQKYFTDKQALKAFKGITNTNALTEELVRFEQHIANSTMPIDFIPSRGLLLEYSGQLADACWLAKQASTAKAHPNIVAVTMAANRGTPTERLVGSCLLIESKTKNGDGIIIIRGLNPIENVANQLDMEDFVKKFGDYVQHVAKNRNSKAAIVIDARGWASTNRQVVANQLEKMKGKLKQASLASDKETNFNGYDLREKTYYL